MTKLNWERINSEKKVQSRGNQPADDVVSVEMPDDFLIDFDPDGNRRVYLGFLKRIVETEMLEKGFPQVPPKITKYVQPLVDHYGDVLAWAKRTREYEQLRLDLVRKKADKIDRIRRQFLHKIAKMEVTSDAGLHEAVPPQEIKEEIDRFKSLMNWANSRPEYNGVRKNAKSYAKRHWKNKN